MTRSRALTFLAGAAAISLVALVVAGCGGGDSPAGAAPAKTAGGQTATVDVASTGLGKILVDANGRTLYLFKKDSGTKSTCFGECAKDWPPLRATKPSVGDGASAAMVSTTKRSDGKSQVTYNGHPLYLFEGDHKAGDTSGQGLNAFGGGWYVLSPAGDQITGSAPSTSSGSGY